MFLLHTVRHSTFFYTVLPVVSLIFVIFSLVMTNVMFAVYHKTKACDRDPLTEETMRGVRLPHEVLRPHLSKNRSGKPNEMVAITTYNLEDIIQLVRKFNMSETPADHPVAPRQLKLAGRSESISASKRVIDRELFNYMTKGLRDTPYPGVEIYTQYAAVRLGLLPLTGVKPLIPSFGLVINDVLSFQYPLTVASCPDKPIGRSVFIAVISACANFDKRNTIRQTWKRHLDVVQQKGLLAISGFAFILGQPESNAMQQQIKQESKIHGDIIQIRMADYYKNLPLKDAGLLNWLNRNCATIDFVAKVDDDVYINMHNLAYFVQSYYLSSYSVFGAGHPKVGLPDREGKWAMSFEEWPWVHYPPYILGAIVLMSADAILPLLAACQTTPMIPYEDIYLYGMCAKKAGIETRYSASPNRALIGSLIRTPTTCELRTLIAWRPDQLDAARVKEIMHSSHQLTDHFYRNTSQCLRKSTTANGTYFIVDRSVPVHFNFK